MRIIQVISLIGLLFCINGNVEGQSAEKPNVLMIIVDDLNDYVGWLNGHPMAETPNLDRFADKGTVFTNAYCNSPSCAPSRTSFMTGKHPEYAGVMNNRSYKDTLVFRDFFTASAGNETVFTLPEILKDSGDYFTYGFHKIYHGWTSGHYDNDFDESTGEDCDRGLSWNRFFDFRLGVDALPDLDSLNPNHHGVDGLEWGPYEDFKEPISNELKVADSVITFFQRYVDDPARYCNKPFFAAYGALRPHTPYYAPDRYFLDYYNNDLYQVPLDKPYNEPADLWPPNGLVMPPRPGGGLTGLEGLGEIANWMATNRNSDEDAIIEFVNAMSPLPVVEPGMDTATVLSILEEAKKAGAVLSYLACIKFVDGQIGRILDALESHPQLADNTIIIMVSDHGYSQGERTHWHKFSLWETDMRIPMIIYDPRTPGGVCNKPVSLLDLFPTVLELTGVQEPTMPDGSRYLDGQSIAPLLANPTRPWGHPTLGSYKMPQQFPEGTCFNQYTVRDDKFHYIRYRTNGAEDDACDFANSVIQEELYEIGENREVDPNEWNNLADDPKYQAVKNYLSQWLPGGIFYGTIAPEVNIVIDNLPCGLTASDTIRLNSEIFDRDGNLLPGPPPSFSYQWTIEPGGLVFTTPSVSLTPADLAGAGSAKSIEVTLELINNTGVVNLLDRKTIRLSNADTDISFNGAIDGNSVSITGVNYPIGLLDGDWDFGDGYVHSGIDPVSHSYSMPGTYLLSRTVHFEGANGSICSTTKAKPILIPAENFDSTACLEVSSVWAVNTGVDKIKLEWNPVFKASSYTIQYRAARETFTSPWLSKNSVNNTTVIKSLQEDELYDVRVIATCPTSSSVPGFPAKFYTEPCKPPVNIRVNDTISPTTYLEWDNGAGNVNKVLVKLFESSTFISRSKILPATVTSVPAGSLPDGSYEVQLQSGCLQYDGTIGTSDPSQPSYFTLGGAARVQEINEIDLYPNPATSEINMNIDSDQPAAGRLYLMDMKGAVRLEQRLMLEAGQNVLNVPVADLPAGIYRVSVVAGTRKWEGKVVVIKGG